MDKSLLRSVLHALFLSAQNDVLATTSRLASELGVAPALIAAALLELDRDGLVDAMRVRLTMLGLAVAARIDAQAEAARETRLAGAARARRVHLAA